MLQLNKFFLFLDVNLVGSSLLVHTSVPYGIQHVEEDKETLKPILMEFLDGLLPNLPKPEFVKSHKWRYSQVSCLSAYLSQCPPR